MKRFFIAFLFFTSLQAYAEGKDDDIKLLQKINLESDLDYYNKSSLLDSNTNEKALYLKNIIDNILLYHPDINSAQLERDIAQAYFMQTTGAFDPNFNSSANYAHFNSSSSVGQEQDAALVTNKLDWQSPWGPKLSVGHKVLFGDAKTPFAPTGDAGEFFAELKIPLLQNALINTYNLKSNKAKIYTIIADYKYFLTKLKVINAASAAYWKWIASAQILDAEKDLLKIAESQLDFVQKQTDAGNFAAINVVEADRELQRRHARVAVALRQVQEDSLKLASYLWTINGHPMQIPSLAQVPNLIPEPHQIQVSSLLDAKFTALENRFEPKILQSTRKILDLEKSFAKNQLLPMLDASLYQGLEVGSEGIGPTMQFGLNFGLPLRLRTARGLLKEAQSKIKQMNIQEKQLLQSIFLDIENAYSQIATSYDRFVFSQKEYALAQKLEEGERLRFELGDSTLFLLIQRERMTIESRIDMIKALGDYNYALVNFDIAQAKF